MASHPNQTPQFPHEAARRLRAAGHTYAYIAHKYRMSIPRVAVVCRNVKPESYRATWVRHHWPDVQSRVLRGDPTRAIWEDSGRPQSWKHFIRAINDELCAYWKRKWRPAMTVQLLTGANHSAEAIAARLGVTDRTVVRLRRNKPLPSCAWAEDIISLRADGLSWLEIKGRVMPRQDRKAAVRVRALVELYEELKLEYEI